MDLNQRLDGVPCGDSMNDYGSELSCGCRIFVAVAVKTSIAP